MAYRFSGLIRAALPLLLGVACGNVQQRVFGQPFPFDPTRTTEVKGVITVVSIGLQGSPPSLTVRSSTGREWTVRLGSMRYLIENSFNPKTGQPVIVSGFPVRDAQGGDTTELVAQQVSLTAIPRTLVFRDPDGRPKWRAQGRRDPEGGKSRN